MSVAAKTQNAITDAERKEILRRKYDYAHSIRVAYREGRMTDKQIERARALGVKFETGVIPGVNDLATTHPELAAQWHPTLNGDLKPSDVTAGCNKKAWWHGPCGHDWDAVINSITRGLGCPYCSNHRLLPGFNDLATTHPELAAQWHPTKNGDLKPSDVMAGSNQKVWWMCDIGHEWAASLGNRSKGTGCPYCANSKVLPGFNDLATMYPELAAEWHPTKNGDLKPNEVLPNSGRKVWWLRKCGHEWEQSISNRVRRGAGCPYCANKKLLKGFNDLATKYPAIASEWHTTKNGDLKPNEVLASSTKKAWWTCPACGHDWEASIWNRTKKGTGCPECGMKASGFAKRKRILCVETGEIFDSVRAASHGQSKADASNICAALRGRTKTAYGYHWRYVEQDAEALSE